MFYARIRLPSVRLSLEGKDPENSYSLKAKERRCYFYSVSSKADAYCRKTVYHQ